MNSKTQLLKRMIREELEQQMATSTMGDSSRVDSSVQSVVDRIKADEIGKKISNIKQDNQKAQLIVKMAQLIGVPRNKMSQIISGLKSSAV